MPPPQAVVTLSCACRKPSSVCAVAMRRSQAIASSAPPPSACPLSAAITGTGNRRTAQVQRVRGATSTACRPRCVPLRVPAGRRRQRSNDHRWPSDTAHFSVVSAAWCAKTLPSRSSSSSDSALRLSGRLIVTRSVSPLRSVRSMSAATGCAQKNSRITHSATQAGRSWPSISTAYSSTSSRLPLTSAADTSLQWARIRLPTTTAFGKRSLLMP